MMTMTESSSEVLTVHCPGCGRRMLLPLAPDLDGDDAKRLARVVRCDRCAGWRAERRPARAEARLPYADD